jgi:hypothetical protein
MKAGADRRGSNRESYVQPPLVFWYLDKLDAPPAPRLRRLPRRFGQDFVFRHNLLYVLLDYVAKACVFAVFVSLPLAWFWSIARYNGRDCVAGAHARLGAGRPPAHVVITTNRCPRFHASRKVLQAATMAT